MDFIPAGSVTSEDPGGAAELAVWKRLKGAFDADETGVAYHQYPIIQKRGNRFDRKPDFVVLHEELGLLVIECKGYGIDQIDYIEGETWHLRNCRQNTIAPLAQARDQGFHLRSFFQRERELRNPDGSLKIPMNTFVALPNVSRAEWEERGFDGPAAPRVILSNELTPVAFRERLSSVPSFEPLAKEEYEVARDVLSCGQAISGGRTTAVDPTKKGDHYERVAQELVGLDRKQQEIGFRIPDGPQQIRGIAGSGKTVLLAMKAARMLVDHGPDPESAVDNDTQPTADNDTQPTADNDTQPTADSDGQSAADNDGDNTTAESEPWNIALTFQTKSLYDHITALVERFYERFADTPFEAVEDDIDIIHAWGGTETGKGLYKTIADETPGVSFRNVGEARRLFDDGDLQEAVAAEVLQRDEIPTLYDAILVDEAQDFGPNFLRMCLATLDDTDRLVWGYDEAQDLGTLSAPSPKNVFGTDDDGSPRLDMSGAYPDGTQKSHIMRTAYRAPREILMAAHGLGMGLKRDGGPVQTVTRQDGWENLGYEIDADFRKPGTEAVITRPVENSPHPLVGEDDARPFLRFERFPRKSDEIAWVADEIAADVHEEGLDPEQILVVILGNKAKGHGHYMLREELESHEIELNCVWNENDKTFAEPGAVTASRIDRAKGNEAPSVYVVGLEAVNDDSYRREPIRRRNGAFVALTRSRAWCTVTGIDQNAPVLDEFERVLGDVRKTEPRLTFDVPDPKALDNELEEDTEGLDASLDDFL
jgi:superfamily I DNA and RNA helicase